MLASAYEVPLARDAYNSGSRLSRILRDTTHSRTCVWREIQQLAVAIKGMFTYSTVDNYWMVTVGNSTITSYLVVYLGDLVTANNVPISNASAYWEEAISPTRERGIPWASIFGNHDDMPFEWPTQWFSTSGMPPIQCPHKCLHLPSSGDSGCYFQGTTRKELMENDSCNPQSMSSSGPHSLWPSVSNYALPVESSRKPGLVVALLYFLDSGGGTYPEIVSFAQATWFEQISQKLNPDLRIPEIVFWHIPSKAYKKVAPRWGIRKPCIGSINLEKVASQEAEMGMMDVIAKRPSVKSRIAICSSLNVPSSSVSGKLACITTQMPNVFLRQDTWNTGCTRDPSGSCNLYAAFPIH
ncbi:hypothetical protein AMTR_s00053p00179520 [Amborella trichopoda]|uniref:Uncharacterized protein n=1 Tax=Amborella trichopoda TaxID=13333 RepID=W1PBQ4_AMBTC|nr:hypothetical protein AMTR_s00053p00179520 [Amborella trichopoda]